MSEQLPTVGQPAPEFELEASNGEKVRLSDFRGQHVVLFFYPRDMTPGCTTEACDFRDRSEAFSGLNTVIIGISPDSVAQHLKFIETYNLPFLLLADEEQTASNLYGVWKLKQMYGNEFMGIERSTFVIDKDGILVKEWRKVTVKDHVDEALAFIQNELA